MLLPWLRTRSPSAPKTKVNILQPGLNLVRLAGGEYVDIAFLDAKLKDSQQTVTGLKITAFSQSGRGSVQVHDASLSPGSFNCQGG